MSILIKGMEMPEGTQTKVVVLLGKIARVNGKDYPVISVPPHGRLGDLDALEAHVMRLCTMAFGEGNGPYHLAYRSLAELVSKTPTIIPAEEGALDG